MATKKKTLIILNSTNRSISEEKIIKIKKEHKIKKILIYSFTKRNMSDVLNNDFFDNIIKGFNENEEIEFLCIGKNNYEIYCKIYTELLKKNIHIHVLFETFGVTKNIKKQIKNRKKLKGLSKKSRMYIGIFCFL